jgi:alpha/beta superfamily hydrolase
MTDAPAPPVPEEVAFGTAYGVTLEGILHLPKGAPGAEGHLPKGPPGAEGHLPKGAPGAEAHLPKGAPGAGVVLCHPHPGLGGTMRTPLVVRLALGLVASGRAVLRFNFRGVGRSGGAQTGGELEPLDVAAAVAFLRSRLGLRRPALAGWSFGSLMAVAHARTDPELAALAAVAPPLAAMGMPGGAEAITAPLLWVAGDRDPYCPSEAIEPLPGEHCVIRGANHFFWAKEDDLIRTIVDFLDRAGA